MSLATKYRPSSFEEVIGQGHIVSSLKKVVEQGRAHAFLFVGPSGTGKTTLARILANTFAGNKATQANIEEINAADLTGVDDMRTIVQRSQYRAVGASPIRAIILDEVHRLSGPAWQVLLKPVEEPPPHVYWMLCTTELGKIPKTILTRCLRYDLRPVEDILIYELLERINKQEVLNVSEAILEACVDEAGGSPRQGLANLELVHGCATTADARRLLRTAGHDNEVVDLCRWLCQSGSSRDWAAAVKRLKGLTDRYDGESLRISIVNYLSAVLLNTTNPNEALRLLQKLECFTTPYNQSDKLAPLLVSVGLAIGLNQ